MFASNGWNAKLGCRLTPAASDVRDGKLTPSAIWELKTQALKKSGLLTLHRGGKLYMFLVIHRYACPSTRGRLTVVGAKAVS